MLAGSGFLPVFAPLHALLAAPPLAINGLSASPWQHGGGAHYSSETVAGLLVGAIFGTRFLASLVACRLRTPPGATVLVVSLAGLAVALLETHAEGILPPARPFAWPTVSPRAARLRPILAQIPPSAPVSAQSNLFPHLSRRPAIYVFPSVEDAEYVVLDVVSPSSPLYPEQLIGEAGALLASPRWQVLAADDGFFLFQRLAEPRLSFDAASLPPGFYDFAHAEAAERSTPVQAVFGDAVDFVGYRLVVLPEVTFGARRVAPLLYVRARQPVDRALRFSIYLVGPGNVTRIYDEGNATQLWYPTYRWPPGALIRLSSLPIVYTAADRLGLGVRIGVAEDAPRLPVTAAGESVSVVDGGRVARFARPP
jgi:hypothetical protein